MGFDLSGKNPKMNVSLDEFKILSKYDKIERWDDKFGSMEEAGDRDQYWNEYNEFQDSNPGMYFRNNCWWWRPLWGYVCDHCADFLTEIDMINGEYNNGGLINKVKSKRIATRLKKLLKSGDVKDYALAYGDWLEEQDDDNFKKNYPFSEENVIHFARFCEESGGFFIC